MTELAKRRPSLPKQYGEILEFGDSQISTVVSHGHRANAKGPADLDEGLASLYRAQDRDPPVVPTLATHRSPPPWSCGQGNGGRVAPRCHAATGPPHLLIVPGRRLAV